MRAGVQERPRAGRVAQPRRHARLHRGGRGGAHHRQRRAPERRADGAAAGVGAGAHRSGRGRHRIYHLSVGIVGLINHSMLICADVRKEKKISSCLSCFPKASMNYSRSMAAMAYFVLASSSIT